MPPHNVEQGIGGGVGGECELECSGELAEV